MGLGKPVVRVHGCTQAGPAPHGPHGPDAAVSCFTQLAHDCTCPASSGALCRAWSCGSKQLAAGPLAGASQRSRAAAVLPGQGPTPQARTTVSVPSSGPGAASPRLKARVPRRGPCNGQGTGPGDAGQPRT